jgi:ribokinase
MFDIITLGSAVEDVFLITNHKIKNKSITFPIGEKILIKRKFVSTGGGGTNTAVAFSRMGFKTGFLGIIGNDEVGHRIYHNLKQEKVTFIGAIGKESGFSVILPTKKDRTILVFKGDNNKLKPSQIDTSKLKTKWLYCSSMIETSFETLKKTINYAEKNNIKIVFNPSSYQAKLGLKKLQNTLEKINILILNKEESFSLSKTDNITDSFRTLKVFIKDIVVITDGSKGAYAFDGIHKYFLKANNKKIIETTGAGDSFASGFISGRLLNKDIPYCLKLGQVLAEQVLQHYGAKNNLPSRRIAEKLLKSEKHIVKKEVL